MILIKTMGDIISKEFHFQCKHCHAEWYADRTDVKITPPFVEYAVYMKCPCCGENPVYAIK